MVEEYYIYHICHFDEWSKTEHFSQYRAKSLELEGFIHCSRFEQVLDVANYLFADSADLVLLCIDPHLLNSELRWESVGDQIYPHVYGPINLGAVKSVREFKPDDDGVFRNFPECG